jgi:hypothetical protein
LFIIFILLHFQCSELARSSGIKAKNVVLGNLTALATDFHLLLPEMNLGKSSVQPISHVILSSHLKFGCKFKLFNF